MYWLNSVILLLLASGAAAHAPDPALRPDSLVLNETIPLAASGKASWPLYLWRRGDYLVEATHESADAAKPVSAVLQLRFTRGDRELVFRRVILRPDRQGNVSRTVLWFTTDREVPLRAEVQVEASVEPTIAGTDGLLRLQIRRKPNVLIRR
jgi:hypothetical protein